MAEVKIYLTSSFKTSTSWRKVMPRSKHPKKANDEAIEASKNKAENKKALFRIKIVKGDAKVRLNCFNDEDALLERPNITTEICLVQKRGVDHLCPCQSYSRI